MYDPEVQGELSFGPVQETRTIVDRLIIDDFIEELDEEEYSKALFVAKRIASDDEPLAETIVAIPVAAHQESSQIFNTLRQYANQRECLPFTVVLDLNSPRLLNEDEEIEFEKTRQEVERAKKQFPWLDVRFFEIRYESPNIGQIRRDLWNGIAQAYIAHGDGNSVPIVLNQDVDLVYMSEKAISAVQNQSRSIARSGFSMRNYFGGISMSHYPDPKYPNISSAVAWHDFVHRKTKATFEAGIFMSLSAYAYRGGFDSKRSKGEIFDGFDLDRDQYVMVNGAFALTSIRRYLDRARDHGLYVWGLESEFTARDECRTSQKFRDISKKHKKELIGENLDLELDNIVRTAIFDYMGFIVGRETYFRANPHERPKDEDEVQHAQQFLDYLLTRDYIVTKRTLDIAGATKAQKRLADNAFRFDSNELAEMIRLAITAYSSGDLDGYKKQRVDVASVPRVNAATIKLYMLDDMLHVGFVDDEEADPRLYS